MLKCKDFRAEDQTPTLALWRKYEPIEGVLQRVNAWIASAKTKVLNVETVSSFSYGNGHQAKPGLLFRSRVV